MRWAVRKIIVANAKEYLASFEIDWSRYSKGAVLDEIPGDSSLGSKNNQRKIATLKDEPACVTVCVVFVNKRTGAQVVVPKIYYDDITGEILQYGCNYGMLSL